MVPTPQQTWAAQRPPQIQQQLNRLLLWLRRQWQQTHQTLPPLHTKGSCSQASLQPVTSVWPSASFSSRCSSIVPSLFTECIHHPLSVIYVTACDEAHGLIVSLWKPRRSSVLDCCNKRCVNSESLRCFCIFGHLFHGIVSCCFWRVLPPSSRAYFFSIDPIFNRMLLFSLKTACVRAALKF